MYSFTIMYRNKRIADVAIHEGKLITCILYDGSCPYFYREGLDITMEMMYTFLESRIPPPDRDNIDQILSFYGLKEYNVYELCKKTHGVDCTDCCWIRFTGENITWEDVKPKWRA